VYIKKIKNMHNLILTPISVDSLTEKIALKTLELLEQKNESDQPHQTIDEEEFLTPKETAKLLKISLPTLWRWQKDGKIKCYGIAGTRYYKKSELLESLTPLKK
jgi:excisionase family DNA binding protein